MCCGCLKGLEIVWCGCVGRVGRVFLPGRGVRSKEGEKQSKVHVMFGRWKREQVRDVQLQVWYSMHLQ